MPQTDDFRIRKQKFGKEKRGFSTNYIFLQEMVTRVTVRRREDERERSKSFEEKEEMDEKPMDAAVYGGVRGSLFAYFFIRAYVRDNLGVQKGRLRDRHKEGYLPVGLDRLGEFQEVFGRSAILQRRTQYAVAEFVVVAHQLPRAYHLRVAHQRGEK